MVWDVGFFILIVSFLEVGQLDDLIVFSLLVESSYCWLESLCFLVWKTCHGRSLHWVIVLVEVMLSLIFDFKCGWGWWHLVLIRLIPWGW